MEQNLKHEKELNVALSQPDEQVDLVEKAGRLLLVEHVLADQLLLVVDLQKEQPFQMVRIVAVPVHVIEASNHKGIADPTGKIEDGLQIRVGANEIAKVQPQQVVVCQCVHKRL